MRAVLATLRRWVAAGAGAAALAAAAAAAPVAFDLPAQRAADAVLEFSRQAGAEVLFSFDQLRHVQSTAVAGTFEPAEALERLLVGTGFAARRTGRGKFVITVARPTSGGVQGRLLLPGGLPAAQAGVALLGTDLTARTDEDGHYHFPAVPAGNYRLLATLFPHRPLTVTGVQVVAGQLRTLEPQTLPPVDEVTKLEPYVVQGRSENLRPFERSELLHTPRTAAGNLDLPRSENGALPYTIYDRDQIARAGVVDLNDFLRRSILEADATATLSDAKGYRGSAIGGSENLNLRAYGSDSTVILVNGRRLPEVITGTGEFQPPDVNLIPLSLVQQIEVLPVSSSALYHGNAVGGIINIVLRPEADANATELTTTYTNALDGFDAPQGAVTLLHGRTLLDGRLRVRVNAGVTRAEPATEAELGHRRRKAAPAAGPDESVFGATPNVRSLDLGPLFGPGSSAVTSVAPGADGTGGLGAFAGREGRRNRDLFDSPGRTSVSPHSLDYPYGRRQRRTSFAASAVWDARPWLQLGLDAVHSRTVVHRGFAVFGADLQLAADHPGNPFGRAVNVSLLDVAAGLGEDYNEARLAFTSVVGGAIVQLPRDWRLTLDAQYAQNRVRYRGLAGADPVRWQELVDTGRYQPLRDTQVSGPPAAFYNEVLLHHGVPGRFVSFGDYRAVDATARLTNQLLELPTGTSTLHLGADYRITELAPFLDELRYADGTLAAEPERWSGRTLERVSVFGELQSPLWPAGRLPAWWRAADANLAVRYIAADSSRESNFAPTFGLKADFARGVTFRGSVTTTNRVPTPQMSRRVLAGPGGPGLAQAEITDPRRGERYLVFSEDIANPDVVPEAAVTQTAGVLWQTGRIHRLRAALDFVDTRKTNEVLWLEPQAVVNLEALVGDRVARGAAAPGDPRPGRITSLLTGPINAARRHSQHWNAALDYAWLDVAGGTLEARARLIWFQNFRSRLTPLAAEVDQFGDPDGTTPGLLRYRGALGASWANRRFGVGFDGHYFHSRLLPVPERVSQGDKQIRPYWQFDVHAQTDLAAWLPGGNRRYGLRAQFRVNNVFGWDYPKYVHDSLGSGVQPYGDWRGRTYSVSLTARF